MLCASQPQVGYATKVTSCRKRNLSQVSNNSVLLQKENKQLRATMLKKRFATVIFKSEQQLLLGKEYDEQQMKKKKEEWKNQQRQIDREAARVAIASIKRTVDFDDNLKAEREILKLISEDKKTWETQLFEEIEKAKLNLQRQRERKAARIALENIKRTVYFDDDLKAEKEFFRLIGAA